MASHYLTRPQTVDPATVTGWGVDADRRNDPTYPMRDRSGDDASGARSGGVAGMRWDRPTRQRPQVEILRSIEHNRLPAVVGTSTPPSGASGALRRVAFRFSESDWTHWLLLLGADRVNAVEGVVADLARGRVPNIPAEMGLRSAWRHDREGVIARAAIGLAVAGVAVALLRSRKDRARRPAR